MKYSISFNGVARRQFLDAAAYYHQITAHLGYQFEDQLDEALVRVSRNPYLHAIKYRDIRFTVLKGFPYKIFYRIHQDLIEVLAVIHHRRDERPFLSEPGNSE